VSIIVATTLASATLVAVTVTVCWLGLLSTAGAVYKPPPAVIEDRLAGQGEP